MCSSTKKNACTTVWTNKIEKLGRGKLRHVWLTSGSVAYSCKRRRKWTHARDMGVADEWTHNMGKPKVKTDRERGEENEERASHYKSTMTV